MYNSYILLFLNNLKTSCFSIRVTTCTLNYTMCHKISSSSSSPSPSPMAPTPSPPNHTSIRLGHLIWPADVLLCLCSRCEQMSLFIWPGWPLTWRENPHPPVSEATSVCSKWSALLEMICATMVLLSRSLPACEPVRGQKGIKMAQFIAGINKVSRYFVTTQQNHEHSPFRDYISFDLWPQHLKCLHGLLSTCWSQVMNMSLW